MIEAKGAYIRVTRSQRAIAQGQNNQRIYSELTIEDARFIRRRIGIHRT